MLGASRDLSQAPSATLCPSASALDNPRFHVIFHVFPLFRPGHEPPYEPGRPGGRALRGIYNEYSGCFCDCCPCFGVVLVLLALFLTSGDLLLAVLNGGIPDKLQARWRKVYFKRTRTTQTSLARDHRLCRSYGVRASRSQYLPCALCGLLCYLTPWGKSS